jgi:hypothetical protein
VERAEPRSWDVLLVGGASGVGKSTLAVRLARRFDLPITAVDDFQVLLEEMTTPDQYPALHFWRTHPDPGSLTAEAIHVQGLDILRVIRPGLEAVIADHLDDERPVVMEGDFIAPAIAEPARWPGDAGHARVRGVFLCEPDADQIVANYLEREPDGGRQDTRAQVSALRSEWLRQECVRLGIPAIPSRPWATLEARVLQAIAGPSGDGATTTRP